MTVTTDVTKTSSDTATATVAGAKVGTQGAVAGRFTLKGLPVISLPSVDRTDATKPLYAVVGVADLALEQAKDVPALVKALPETVETRVSTAADKAGDLYSQLTVRGRRLVTQIRRQPATQAAVAEGKEAVRQASSSAAASATAAKKSAKAGEQAVEDAAATLG